MSSRPRIFETVLYADDLQTCARFYHEVLGLEMITRSDLVVSFRCADGVLLLFDPNRSAAAGRDVPSHGRAGAGHLAFAATESELEQWRRRLASANVAVEAEIQWEQGGRSIYFRDPAGNSIEFAPLTLWGGGW
jgi:catechol-2,3-dioxygenase